MEKARAEEARDSAAAATALVAAAMARVAVDSAWEVVEKARAEEARASVAEEMVQGAAGLELEAGATAGAERAAVARVAMARAVRVAR